MPRIQVNPGTPVTGGNNPWVDAVTYNAQWQQKNWNSPVRLRISFLQPRQFGRISDEPVAQAKLSDSSYAGWDPKNPAARFPASVQQTYLDAYQTWSDVALITAKPIKNPQKADVVFILANYNNDGYLSGRSGPQLQGSHEGLLRQGKAGFQADPAALPLISDANATVVEELLIAPSGADIAPGSNFFKTAIHEIGHGIGLSHPHDSGLGSVPSGVFPGLTPNDSFGNYGTGLYALNQEPYTVMTYVKGFDDGSVIRSMTPSMTPMALDVMAAQLKYGANMNAHNEDNIYDLLDIFKLNAWQCIWDTGGIDTITGEKLLFSPLTINLRPAEMNAVQPETGSPSERYEWGVASNWGEAIDTFLGLSASRMGFLLGNGIVEAYQLKYYLDNIYANDQPRWLAIEKQIFEPLTHNLSQLKAQAFDYGDWSRALNTLAGGELSSLSSALSGAAADATSPSERRMLRLAAKTAKYFTAIKDITNGIDVFLATNLGDNEYLDYLDGLAEARAVQNAIMTRSAPGVAGYVSTETPELYQYGQNPGGFTIAAGVTIENAIGGQGNDEIIGNAANNKLYGNAGDDLIDGYLGNNLIDGGDGTDTAILFGAFSDYSFSGSATSLRATNHTRGFENTLVSIEAVKIGDITYSPSVLLL